MKTKIMKRNQKESLRLEAALIEICGAENVHTDSASRDFFASDLYEKGAEPHVIVAPNSAEEIAKVVKVAREYIRPIYIRGGGMSYSNAYLPDRDASVMMDMRQMDAIREINTEDLYVTVEAGCTWKALDEVLEPLNLRAVFWGPFSGLKATIGGSMSQGTANNAAARIGTSDSTVLSYEIVTGTGEIFATGKNAQENHKPFIRNYGPDLTSIFSNDAGALGIKTAVTLRLEPRPKAYGGVSYAFENFSDTMKAVKQASQLGIASAIIAMDAQTAGIRAGERGLKEDLKKLLAVMKSAHNPLLGFWRGVQIALAGGRVFERASYTAHFLAEGMNENVLITTEKSLRSKIKSHGIEIPNIAISMMRLENFPDLPLTHMDGRRMLPVHGILPWSAMDKYNEAYFKIIADYKSRMEEHQVIVADVFTAIGPSSLLCEPVFYWPDKHTDYQKEMTSNVWSENWKDVPDNPEARALVAEIKEAIIDLQFLYGAAHIQIGKQYPYMNGRSENNRNFLKSIKTEMDPDNIINPGALGLEG